MKLNEDPNALVEVENPKYQPYEEICRDFFGKAVLITEIDRNESGKILGGIVKYYTLTNKGIYDKWEEEYEKTMDKDPEGERCMIRPMFPFNYYGGLL